MYSQWLSDEMPHGQFVGGQGFIPGKISPIVAFRMSMALFPLRSSIDRTENYEPEIFFSTQVRRRSSWSVALADQNEHLRQGDHHDGDSGEDETRRRTPRPTRPEVYATGPAQATDVTPLLPATTPNI
ncbi:hypothetical protein ACFYXF_12525 [Streptomyces sp. NPDC002680]|uniref:hypothetical protein n=1 Tax=Streptomyces sp. NPDC002680 TaxID=3364659 RepID=UPI00367503E5